MKPIQWIAVVVLLALPAWAHAAMVTLTSSNFSFGYGYSGNFAWDTSETNSVNTSTTQGSFTFTPSVSGLGVSGAGPTFINRVLSDGNLNTAGARASTFAVTVTGAYTGTLPTGAFNPQLTLNITAVKIWGAQPNAFPQVSPMQFLETTTGNTGSSSQVSMNTTTSATQQETASFYKQLVWDPSELAVAGVSSSRSFDLNTYGGGRGASDSSLYEVDGFEVLGNVILTYSIPEPASLTLLALGGAIVLRQRRK